MYHNPVEVIKTNNWREKCRSFQKNLNIHNPLIITSKGNLSRQKLSSKFNFESKNQFDSSIIFSLSITAEYFFE